MSVFENEWVEVDSPEATEDNAYVNPNAELKSKDPFEINSNSLNPQEIENDEWDIVKESLSAPESVGVDSVGVNFRNGLIGVYDNEGLTSYVLGAIGDQGSFAIVDSNGNVSDNATNLMSVKHNAAVVETIHDEVEVGQEVAESDVGFASAAQMYEDIMDAGEYEAVDADVKYTGFDTVKGSSKIAGDEAKASKFIEKLEKIAEFYEDFEEDYNPNSNEVDPEIPTTPMRDGGKYHKFRIPNTGNDVSLIIDKNYDKTGDIELNVKAFGDHSTDTSMY